MNFGFCDTFIGKIKIAESDNRIVQVMLDCRDSLCSCDIYNGKSHVLSEAVAQMKAYFNGRLRKFDLPLLTNGTVFMKKVWDCLREIPYGTTVSYKDISASIRAPKACRAVGMANHKNQIPIIIPCHRVIGVRGNLVGFRDGIDIKKKLIVFEKNNLLNF